jgi:hypothetical protein
VRSTCTSEITRGSAAEGLVSSDDRSAATASLWRTSVARLSAIRAWLRSQARCAASHSSCAWTGALRTGLLTTGSSGFGLRTVSIMPTTM